MKSILLLFLMIGSVVFADTPPVNYLFNSPLVKTGNTVSCNVASTSIAGCLSAASFNIFNNKQDALGFTPVNKAGDTMTGLLLLSSDPVANLGAATKQYVDSHSGANTSLSNLTSPVAFNQDLVPGVSGARQLGSNTKFINDIWTNYSENFGIDFYGDTTYAVFEGFIQGNLSLGDSYGAASMYFEGDNPTNISNKTAVRIHTPDGNQYSGAIVVDTGGSTGANSKSGDLILTSGPVISSGSTGITGDVIVKSGPSDGVRGKVKLINGTEGTVGHVWTELAGDGSGGWEPSALSQNQIWVDAVTGNDSYNGSPTTPLKTISAAMTKIGSASSSVDFNVNSTARYRVHVAPGVYTETVSVPTRQYIELDMDGALIIGNVTQNVDQSLLVGAISKTKLVLKGSDLRNAYDGSGYPQTGIIGDILMTGTNLSTKTEVLELLQTGVNGNVKCDTALGTPCLMFLSDAIVTGTIETLGHPDQITLYIENADTSSSKAIGGVNGFVVLNILRNVRFNGPVIVNNTQNGARWFNTEFKAGQAHNFTGSSGAISADANSLTSFNSNVPSKGTVTFTRLDDAFGVGYSPATPSDWDSAPTYSAQALDDLAFTRLRIAGDTMVGALTLGASSGINTANITDDSADTNSITVQTGANTFVGGSVQNTGGLTFTSGPITDGSGNSTGSNVFKTGDANGTNPGGPNSGSFTFQTGSAANSSGNLVFIVGPAVTRGKLQFQDGSQGTVGHVWTESANDGSGGWAALPTVATGNLTDAGTDGITVTGGTGAVVGSGTSFAQHVSDSTHNGYLSSTDWSTFNNKQATGLTVLKAGDTMTGTLQVPTVNLTTKLQVNSSDFLVVSGATTTENLWFGQGASSALTTGTGNLLISSGAANNTLTSGLRNTLVGNAVLPAITTGSDNVALGTNIAPTATTLGQNTFVGNSIATAGGGKGERNVGVGYAALGNIAGASSTAGAHNVSVGYNTCAGVSSGSGNTCVGYQADTSTTTGTNNTTIGINAGPSGNFSNSTAIGNSASATASNMMAFGNTSVTQNTFSGNLTAATFQPTVQGSGVTPTCGVGQNGELALTHAYILCVCNTTSWVKTSDGSTACTF